MDTRPRPLYLPFGGVALLSVLDRDRRVRTSGLIAFAVGSSLILGIVQANLDTPRPHIGHLAGVGGVLYYDWPSVLLYAIRDFVIVFPFVYCLEDIALSFWDAIRKLLTLLNARRESPPVGNN